MSNLRIFSNKIPINGKRLLLRVDLNVPIANSEIKDDVRIKTILPFLSELIKKKCQDSSNFTFGKTPRKSRT